MKAIIFKKIKKNKISRNKPNLAYSETYKTLMKETENDTGGKTYHVHELEVILLKLPYYPRKSRYLI